MLGNDLARIFKVVEKRLKSIEVNSIQQLAYEMLPPSPVGNPALWKNQSNARWMIKQGYVGGKFKATWEVGIDALQIDWTKANYKFMKGGVHSVMPSIDRTGLAAMTRISAELKGIDSIGHVYHIANQLPYANRLAKGWSTQAPDGWVRDIAVMRFNGIVANAAAKARSLY